MRVSVWHKVLGLRVGRLSSSRGYGQDDYPVRHEVGSKGRRVGSGDVGRVRAVVGGVVMDVHPRCRVPRGHVRTLGPVRGVGFRVSIK